VVVILELENLGMRIDIYRMKIDIYRPAAGNAGGRIQSLRDPMHSLV
jgi:hypothetical protein